MDKKKVEIERIRNRLIPTFTGQIPGSSLSLIAALIIYFYFRKISGFPQALWLSISAIFVFARVGLAAWYLSQNEKWNNIQQHKNFETLYTQAVFFAALIWGCALFVFFPLAKGHDVIFPVIFPVGVMVSALPNLATSKKGAYAFIFGLMLGFTGYFIYDWQELSPFMILTAIVFTGSLLRSSEQSFNDYQNLQRMLDEANETIHLKEELTHQKMISAQTSKLASLGEMAGGVAHEINNPLTIIKLKSESLVKKYNKNSLTNETTVECSKIISETVDRIKKIIDGLLLFSRDHSEVEKEPISIQKLLEEVIDMTDEKFRTRDIIIHKSFGEEDYMVCVNRIALSQVIINLLNNSYYFIKERPNPWISISVDLQENNMLEISFTDCGQEIEKSIAEKIFNPFYTSKPVGEGTGLGLSISKGILKEHEGDIQLRNFKHPCFVLTLPLWKDQPKDNDEEAA